MTVKLLSICQEGCLILPHCGVAEGNTKQEERKRKESQGKARQGKESQLSGSLYPPISCQTGEHAKQLEKHETCSSKTERKTKQKKTTLELQLPLQPTFNLQQSERELQARFLCTLREV